MICDVIRLTLENLFYFYIRVMILFVVVVVVAVVVVVVIVVAVAVAVIQQPLFSNNFPRNKELRSAP